MAERPMPQTLPSELAYLEGLCDQAEERTPNEPLNVYRSGPMRQMNPWLIRKLIADVRAFASLTEEMPKR